MASITGMVARMITDYSIQSAPLCGETERRPWLLINHGGEITNSGRLPPLVARDHPPLIKHSRHLVCLKHSLPIIWVQGIQYILYSVYHALYFISLP